MLCEYGCGQEGIYKMSSGKMCCSKNYQSCPKLREVWRKNSTGVKHTSKTRKKMSQSSYNKLTIRIIMEKYPTFSKIEDMRYHPKTNEIQVHCTNHNCPNSKELNGWYTPTKSRINNRIREIEMGSGGSYFYCSDKCRDECPLFNLHSDPLSFDDKPYTHQEYQIWRNEVLGFQLKDANNPKNYCEYCLSNENIEVHHIYPVKTHPHMALDPKNGLVACKDCHLNKAHIDECSTGKLATVNCKEVYK